MSIIVKPNSTANGTTADGAKVSANFDTIYADYNGNITDANIAASGITTYGKVNGAAISNLSGMAVGAGALPIANLTIASKAQAEAGTDQTTVMNPLRTAQAIAALGGDAFGAWNPYSTGTTPWAVNTVYLAATDGHIVGYLLYSAAGAGQQVQCLTDSANPPTTVRTSSVAIQATNVDAIVSCPVKKGEYWKVNATAITALYWIPKGS